MKLFETRKIELFQLHCEDEGINSLPAESQIFLLKKFIPGMCFKKDSLPSDTLQQVLLIGGKLYQFCADVCSVKEGIVQLKNVQFHVMDTVIETAAETQTIPSIQSEEADDKNISSETKPEVVQKDITSAVPAKENNDKNPYSHVRSRLFGNRSQAFQQFSMYFHSGFKNTFNEEERSFKILQKEQLDSSICTPYIYSYHEQFTTCLNGYMELTSSNRLIAKLLIPFHGEEEKKYLMRLDKEKDFTKQFIDMLKNFDPEQVQKFLTHIDETELLAQLKGE